MTGKLLLAGILGGVAMFIWSAIAHTALPLGDAGMKELPDQQSVLPAMEAALGDNPGLYLFPGLGVGDNPTHEQKSEAMKHMNERLASNPSGLMMYFPPGRTVNMGKLLSVEFITEVIESILAVFLLAQTRINSFGGRVGFILVAGILAAITTNVSYWNWYGFPGVYVVSYMTIQIVGFLVAGIAAAFVLRKSNFSVG